MTIFLDGLTAAVTQITTTPFDVRAGQDVPTTNKVGYDQAVELDATWLYIDMLDSSGLVALAPRQTVGKVVRLFLDVTVRVMENNGGEIRSFDGDRVMAIFVGIGRQDVAVKAAMQVKWACTNLLQPALSAKYKSIREARWRLHPASGVSSGAALIVRGGVRRKDNDLASIGLAPNLAAKLSDYRSNTQSRHVRIDSATYDGLTAVGRISSGKDMWSSPCGLDMGGKNHLYRYSTYTWKIV